MDLSPGKVFLMLLLEGNCVKGKKFCLKEQNSQIVKPHSRFNHRPIGRTNGGQTDTNATASEGVAKTSGGAAQICTIAAERSILFLEGKFANGWIIHLPVWFGTRRNV
jgi:hypothetical protein